MPAPQPIAPGVFYVPPPDRPASPFAAYLSGYMALASDAAKQGFYDHLKPMSPAERVQALAELERIGQLRDQVAIQAQAQAEEQQAARMRIRQGLTTTAADLERQRADAASAEARTAAEQSGAVQRSLIGFAQEQASQRGQLERTNAETARALLLGAARSAGDGGLDAAKAAEQEGLIADFQARVLGVSRERGAPMAIQVEAPEFARRLTASPTWQAATPGARAEMARRMMSVVTDLEPDAATAGAARLALGAALGTGAVGESARPVAPPVDGAAGRGGAGTSTSTSTRTSTSEPAPSEMDLAELARVRRATASRVSVGSSQAPIREMIGDVQRERNAVDVSLRPVEIQADTRAREIALQLLSREGPGAAAPIEAQAIEVLRRIRGGAR